MRKQFRLKATIFDKKGRVISIGENSYLKTHPMQRSFGIKTGNPKAVFIHAEIAALVKLKDWAKAYRIMIERYDENGHPKLAKPCAACSLALEKAGIKVVEYTK